VVDGIESKRFRVFLPSGADELVRSKAVEYLEALGEVVAMNFSRRTGPRCEVLGASIALLPPPFAVQGIERPVSNVDRKQSSAEVTLCLKILSFA
jgi:hypothetical protein